MKGNGCTLYNNKYLSSLYLQYTYFLQIRVFIFSLLSSSALYLFLPNGFPSMTQSYLDILVLVIVWCACITGPYLSPMFPQYFRLRLDKLFAKGIGMLDVALTEAFNLLTDVS